MTTCRWPAWVDGLERVLDVSRAAGPQRGGRIAWESGPAGRGRVTETVIAYAPLGGQTVEVRGRLDPRSPERRVRPGAGRRRGDAERSSTRSSGRSILTPLVDCAVHPARDGEVAAHDAHPLRRRARRRPRLTAVARACRRRHVIRPTPRRDAAHDETTRLTSGPPAVGWIQLLAPGPGMFVFKAAVVGAGTMGGEIAHMIANADIPVVLKDVDARPRGVRDRARRARCGRAGSTPARWTSAELERRLALITGTTELRRVRRRRLRDRGGSRARSSSSRRCSPSSTRSRRATRSSPRTPRRCRSPRWGRSTSRPGQGRRLSLLLSGIGRCGLIEVIEGEDTSPETAQAASNFAQAIRKMPIRCGDSPGFVVNRILNSTASELWRSQEESGIDVEELDKIVAESKAAPMGPFFLADLLGLDTVLQRHRAPAASPTATASTSTGRCASSSPTATSAPRPERASMSTGAELERADARRSLHAEGVRRELPRARGGRGVDEGHRPRDDGRGRDDPAAVRPRRSARPRRGPRQARARGARVGGGLRAADDPAPAGRAGPPRRQDRPGLLPVPEARRRLGGRRRSSSRRRGEIAIAWLDRPPANSISPDVVRRAAQAVGRGHRRRERPRADLRLGEPDAVLRRRGHQGVHADGRGRREGAGRRHARAAARDGALARS